MIIAFRAWIPTLKVDHTPILKSFVANYYWEGPVVEGSKPTANIDNHELTVDSNTNEEFGFFSFSSFSSLPEMLFEEDMEDSIMGVVQPFGLVQHHEQGYRSSSLQVIALCDRVKCALGRCDESVEVWVAHKQNDRITGVCSNHIGIINAKWMQSLCGENPLMIDHSQYMKGLAFKYHCEILDYNQLKKAKENYGSWRTHED
jgi:hypothetical protein